MQKKYTLIIAFIMACVGIQAQNPVPEKTVKKKSNKSIYFSWGYNKEWYTRSNLKVDQPELNSKYTLQRVKAHDHPGWDHDLFKQDLTIPQYNYRIGYMFNEEKGWGVEINFDHTKYIIAEGQTVRVKGTLEGKAIDDNVFFDPANGFYYFLNNGANFFLLNLVKRWHLAADRKKNIQLDGVAKIGVGPVVPHVENSLFGHANEPHFQIGGWNTGLEGTLKATFFKYVYLEYCAKLDYASYSNLRIYKGTAKQSFGTFEMILNLGGNIPF